MSKIYYNGNTNKGFTYEDLKKVYDILGCDEEALAEIVTRGYDSYSDEGLNCDSYSDGSCDHMIQMFDDCQSYNQFETVQDHWNLFCSWLREDKEFSTFALWHRALNVHNWRNDDVDASWFESCVDTFLGMMTDYYQTPNKYIHIGLETLWCSFYEDKMEDDDEYPTYNELVVWYLSNIDVRRGDKILELFTENYCKEAVTA